MKKGFKPENAWLSSSNLEGPSESAYIFGESLKKFNELGDVTTQSLEPVIQKPDKPTQIPLPLDTPKLQSQQKVKTHGFNPESIQALFRLQKHRQKPNPAQPRLSPQAALAATEKSRSIQAIQRAALMPSSAKRLSSAVIKAPKK